MADFTTEVRERFKATSKDRATVRRLVAAGRRVDAEPSIDRSRAFVRRRMRRVAPRGPEAFTGDMMEALGTNFLSEGAQIRRAVGYVEVNAPRRSVTGSGFLIGPGLFLTNCHVIEDAAAARGTQIVFDKEIDELGRPRATTTFLLDPDRLLLLSPPEELDYAVVALGQRSNGMAMPEELGFCALSDSPDRHALGINVNIIQHPRGWSKMAALRKNLLVARTDTTLHYETDTDQGSSGAPVFNDDWDVIALHHWGEPFLATEDEDGHPIGGNLNEGVRISAIYRDLEARLAKLDAEGGKLLAQALDKGRPQPSAAGARRLTPPRPAVHREEAHSLIGAKPMSTPSEPGAIRITLPLEITIRIGDSMAPVMLAPTAVAVAPPVPTRTLTRAAEALRRDNDYANREGYDADFITGHSLPLPKLNARLKKQLAPLRDGEPNAKDGELKYVHFSIKMNKIRQMAIFTATNIDGETYLAVNRKTGAVEEAAEGDTWFNDPRVSGSFVLGQPFYGEWSHLFDRGHLTRRSDPTWGDAEDAERANADTFHFTNCSPQHFRFNQAARFWQGAERYVLENGVLAAGQGKRISVFQGPIFDDRVDLSAGEVQIPSSFFKIVAWEGADGLKSVGLVVDQKNLLAEERKFIGTPSDLPAVDVAQWRVNIGMIEKRTGLDFGDAIRAADTIRTDGQPLVGGEAQILVRDFADLLPA